MKQNSDFEIFKLPGMGVNNESEEKYGKNSVDIDKSSEPEVPAIPNNPNERRWNYLDNLRSTKIQRTTGLDYILKKNNEIVSRENLSNDNNSFLPKFSDLFENQEIGKVQEYNDTEIIDEDANDKINGTSSKIMNNSSLNDFLNSKKKIQTKIPEYYEREIQNNPQNKFDKYLNHQDQFEDQDYVEDSFDNEKSLLHNQDQFNNNPIKSKNYLGDSLGNSLMRSELANKINNRNPINDSENLNYYQDDVTPHNNNYVQYPHNNSVNYNDLSDYKVNYPQNKNTRKNYDLYRNSNQINLNRNQNQQYSNIDNNDSYQPSERIIDRRYENYQQTQEAYQQIATNNLYRSEFQAPIEHIRHELTLEEIKKENEELINNQGVYMLESLKNIKDKAKNEILSELLDGEWHSEKTLMRIVKKTRYIGNVGFGMMMVSFNELVSNRFLMRKMVDQMGYYFKINDSFVGLARAACRKKDD